MYIANPIESVLAGISFLDSPQGKILKAKIWEAIKLAFCICCYISYKTGKLCGELWYTRGRDFVRQAPKKIFLATSRFASRIQLDQKVEQAGPLLDKAYQFGREKVRYVLSGIFVYHFQD